MVFGWLTSLWSSVDRFANPQILHYCVAVIVYVHFVVRLLFSFMSVHAQRIEVSLALK